MALRSLTMRPVNSANSRASSSDMLCFTFLSPFVFELRSGTLTTFDGVEESAKSRNAFTITNRPIPCLRFGHRSGCRVGIETTLPQWSGALRSRGVGQSRKVLCCRRRMLVERFEICFTFQSLVLVYSVLDLGFGPVFRLMPNPAATVRTRQRETPSVRATCS